MPNAINIHSQCYLDCKGDGAQTANPKVSSYLGGAPYPRRSRFIRCKLTAIRSFFLTLWVRARPLLNRWNQTDSFPIVYCRNDAGNVPRKRLSSSSRDWENTAVHTPNVLSISTPFNVCQIAALSRSLIGPTHHHRRHTKGRRDDVLDVVVTFFPLSLSLSLSRRPHYLIIIMDIVFFLTTSLTVIWAI